MRTERSNVVCTGVKPSDYNSKVDQAELRQTVTTFYPSTGVNAGHDELISLGDADDLEFSSERVVWLNVPKGTTQEQVTAALSAKPTACIQRYLSFKPMLEEGDMVNGITAEEKSKSQVVRNENGEVVLFGGKPGFRRYYFRDAFKEDVDLRPETSSDAFTPEWLQAELEVFSDAPASIEAALESDIPA